MKKKTWIGGIIKHNHNGIGFKLTFKTKKEAQHYKEMIIFILKNDNYHIKQKEGYYDNKDNN